MDRTSKDKKFLGAYFIRAESLIPRRLRRGMLIAAPIPAPHFLLFRCKRIFLPSNTVIRSKNAE